MSRKYLSHIISDIRFDEAVRRNVFPDTHAVIIVVVAVLHGSCEGRAASKARRLGVKLKTISISGESQVLLVMLLCRSPMITTWTSTSLQSTLATVPISPKRGEEDPTSTSGKRASP